jgi:short-subunit dehydrogenase
MAGAVAIVTGGDSPLARAVALCLAHNGADVVLLYRSEHGGVREAVRRMRIQGVNAVALFGDLADPAFGRQVVDATLVQLGHSDALFDERGGAGFEPAQQPPSVDRLLSQFSAGLQSQLAEHGVELKALTRAPLWSPLIAADLGAELPVNQHLGNSGPCFVFMARDDAKQWAPESSRWAHSAL